MQTNSANRYESPGASEGLWTVRDVAAFIKCSQSWVYKASERGELPCVPIAGMIRFDPEEIRQYARKAQAREHERKEALRSNRVS